MYPSKAPRRPGLENYNRNKVRIVYEKSISDYFFKQKREKRAKWATKWETKKGTGTGVNCFPQLIGCAGTTH